MKKQTKGAIAAGAAALLLAGGAGTMAAWSDSAGLGTNSTVTAGKLTITENVGGGWTWQTPSVTTGPTAVGATFDPVNQRIVPGDIVQYTSTYTIGAVGNNLKATLTPNLQGGIAGDLKPFLDVTGSTNTTGVDLANITQADNGKTISVLTTIEFQNVNEKVGQEKTADLAGATVVLKQTAPAA